MILVVPSVKMAQHEHENMAAPCTMAKQSSVTDSKQYSHGISIATVAEREVEVEGGGGDRDPQCSHC